MRSLLSLGVLLAAGTCGCAMTIPDSTPYPRTPSAAEPEPGMSLCNRTGIAAHSLSRAQAAGGWTLMGFGIASATSGTIATVVNDQQNRLMAAAGLTLGGVALGIIAYHLLLRSSASARLGETADLALLDRPDRHAWETCVRAKAAWEGSKADADGITHELAAQKERENRELREEIEALRRRPAEAPRPAPEPLPRP